MDELTSRSALLKMARRYEEYDEGGWSMTVKAVPVEAIKAAPAVDAVPAVHARWELHGNDDDCSSSYFCTNCGSGYDEELFYDHEHYAPYLFCPHCSAKMDLE